MKNRSIILLALVIIAATLLILKAFVLKDTVALREHFLNLSYRSNKKLLSAGNSVLIISDEIEQKWKDSIKYIVFVSDSALDRLNSETEGYSSDNSIIVVINTQESNHLSSFMKDDFIIDRTKLFDFILSDTLSMAVLSIARREMNHFEISDDNRIGRNKE